MEACTPLGGAADDELAGGRSPPPPQASTSEVYGDPEISPQTEEYWGHVNCNGVRSCYDEGKRVAETLTFDYMREHDLEVRVIRIFNTYGPRMAIDDGRVAVSYTHLTLPTKA